MSITTKPKTKRRRDSAIAGGEFCSQRDLELRWGCNAVTAMTRLRNAGIRPYHFAKTSLRYKLADVVAYEESLKI
jgi:hypothetical protein